MKSSGPWVYPKILIFIATFVSYNLAQASFFDDDKKYCVVSTYCQNLRNTITCWANGDSVSCVNGPDWVECKTEKGMSYLDCYGRRIQTDSK